MKKLYNTGDTIVEVLIAITIISSVLGVAYATMNRASQNARQAQERGVATKLLESQAESLKAKATDNTTAVTVFNVLSNAFCIDNAFAIKPFDSGFVYTDDFSAYVAKDCAVDETGSTYSSTAGVQYNIAIVRSSDPAKPNNFTIYCRWDGLGTQGIQQASLSYRVYQ